MRKFVQKLTSAMGKPFGLKTVRRSHADPLVQDKARGQLRKAIEDLDTIFRRCVAPSLPRNERRLALLEGTIGTSPAEAYFVLAGLHEALAVAGDVCEFGVAQGVTSAVLANELLATDRHLWLFDTFEGLPKPSDKDELIDDIFDLGKMSRYEGRMAKPAARVQARLADVGFPEDRTHIVKGEVHPDRVPETMPDRICFAYLDFDFYEGTQAALALVHPRMPVGGRLVVDDYGFFSTGVETAVAEFLAGPGAGAYTLSQPLEGDEYFAVLAKTA